MAEHFEKLRLIRKANEILDRIDELLEQPWFAEEFVALEEKKVA